MPGSSTTRRQSCSHLQIHPPLRLTWGERLDPVDSVFPYPEYLLLPVSQASLKNLPRRNTCVQPCFMSVAIEMRKSLSVRDLVAGIRAWHKPGCPMKENGAEAEFTTTTAAVPG